MHELFIMIYCCFQICLYAPLFTNLIIHLWQVCFHQFTLLLSCSDGAFRSWVPISRICVVIKSVTPRQETSRHVPSNRHSANHRWRAFGGWTCKFVCFSFAKMVSRMRIFTKIQMTNDPAGIYLILKCHGAGNWVELFVIIATLIFTITSDMGHGVHHYREENILITLIVSLWINIKVPLKNKFPSLWNIYISIIFITTFISHELLFFSDRAFHSLLKSNLKYIKFIFL